MVKGISAKEMEVISHLEFNRQYFFMRADISKFFRSTNLMNYYIHNLRSKGRIVKLNRTKYFLIPVKAKGGHWAEHPLIITDEIMNGKDYFVGGVYAAYQWDLIDQVPRQVDVYTTKKQGEMVVFNIKIIFHRTTRCNLENAVRKKIGNHHYLIANKKKAQEWAK